MLRKLHMTAQTVRQRSLRQKTHLQISLRRTTTTGGLKTLKLTRQKSVNWTMASIQTNTPASNFKYFHVLYIYICMYVYIHTFSCTFGTKTNCMSQNASEIQNLRQKFQQLHENAKSSLQFCCSTPDNTNPRINRNPTAWTRLNRNPLPHESNSFNQNTDEQIAKWDRKPTRCNS